MSLIIFILILALLILAHEFGHFSVAKMFGIRVDEFGIGFPPRLLSITWGETTYSLNLLFFGGFVKIFGENASPTGEEVATDPRSFVHKSRLVQAAVVVAGIVFNILFAWLALSVGYMVGMPTSDAHVGVGEVRDVHTTIVHVLPGSPAEKAGLLANDQIKSIMTASARLPEGATATEVQQFIADHQDESDVITIVRHPTSLEAGESPEKTFLAKPVEGIAGDHKAIGIQLDDVGILQLPPHLALYQGALLTTQMTVAIAEGLGDFLKQIFTGHADLGTVTGPIGIAGMGAAAVTSGFVATVVLTALISINLAIINVLPIPGLDGGRLLFIIVEAIIRRPLPEKVSVYFSIAGFALLILLMLVVSFHDVARLLG